VPIAPATASTKPTAAAAVKPSRTRSSSTTTPMSEDTAVLVVNMMAVTAVARPRCRATANATAATSPLTIIAQSAGSTTRCRTGPDASSVRAEIPTVLNPSPAQNPSTIGDQRPAPRWAVNTIAAITTATPTSSSFQPGGSNRAGPGSADRPSSTSPAAPTPSAAHPAATSRTPRTAEMVAVTPTLNARTDWTRNSGRRCSAAAAKTNPSRSTPSPRK
jgi:hypothetical protein